jgi:putative NADH-flavin reductase
MKVVIFGATGFSGKAILREALSQGHQVTVLVRNAKAVVPQPQLHIVEGNVLDPAVVDAVLLGQEAVIQCLGVGGKGDGKPTTFVSTANQVIMDAMKKNQVPRLIAMSIAGAGDSLAFTPWIFRKVVLPFFMKWLQVLIDDKNRMEPMIKATQLQWTIVRCAGILDKPSRGKVTTTLDGKGLKFSITLHDMARFIVGQVTDKQFVKKCVSISN